MKPIHGAVRSQLLSEHVACLREPGLNLCHAGNQGHSWPPSEAARAVNGLLSAILLPPPTRVVPDFPLFPLNPNPFSCRGIVKDAERPRLVSPTRRGIMGARSVAPY